MRVGKTGRKNVKAVDLVGTTYKGFSVLDCKRENNRTYLFVRCPVCKKEKWIRKTTLDQDKTVSCGCIRDKYQFKQVNIKGQKFGHLTALEPTSKTAQNNSTIWLCRCDCGNLKEVSIKDLSSGGVKSCGCLRFQLSTEKGKNLAQGTREYCVNGTNARNLTAKTPVRNKSGVKGVCWDKNRKKWIAQIRFQGKNYSLGRYNKIEDAAAARKEAEEHLFGPFLKWFYEMHPNLKRSEKSHN